MTRSIRIAVLAVAWAGLVLSVGTAAAQQIILDKPVRAGQLTLFPELSNPNVYYYLPDKASLATDPNGNPAFSFLRYVENVRSAADTREGEGGGIFHVVVEMNVTQAMLDEARQALRRINSSGTIQGPVVYKSGTIALISSFKENNEFTKKVIGLGSAPLLDNQKVSVSLQLTKLGAKILSESIKMGTSDLSVRFEMQMTGFRSPIGATIEANFDQMYTHQNFEAAVASPILAAEIKTTFDDLVKSGAIKVTQVGSDEKIEKAVEAAYTKLISMMFDPVGGSGTPALGQLAGVTGSNQPSMLDRATTLLNNARAETRAENDRRRAEVTADEDRIASASGGGGGGGGSRAPARGDSSAVTTHRSESVGSASGASMDSIEARAARRRNRIDASQTPLPSLAVAMSYEMKRVHQQGIFRIDLNKYNTDNLAMTFECNVGGLNCAPCVKDVNLDDPLYVQREVTAYVDGANATDFDKYINAVSLTMRKTHAKGAKTLDELRVDRKSLNAEGNNFKLLYGWKDDTDRTKWLEYEYKTDWFFFGGYTVASEWQKSVAGAIPLSPPLIRRVISIEADPDLLKQANVRSIEVKVYSKIGTQEDIKETRLNTRANQFATQLDVIQPKNVLDYEYETTWYLADGTKKASGRKTTNSAVLFVDSM
jgi:hypothetical protein